MGAGVHRVSKASVLFVLALLVRYGFRGEDNTQAGPTRPTYAAYASPLSRLALSSLSNAREGGSVHRVSSADLYSAGSSCALWFSRGEDNTQAGPTRPTYAVDTSPLSVSLACDRGGGGGGRVCTA